jgi:hypothetical protein
LQAFPTGKNNGMILIFWLSLAQYRRPRKLYPINNLQSKQLLVKHYALLGEFTWNCWAYHAYGWIQMNNHKIISTLRTAK